MVDFNFNRCWDVILGVFVRCFSRRSLSKSVGPIIHSVVDFRGCFSEFLYGNLDEHLFTFSDQA